MSDLRYCSCLPQVRFLDTRDHAPGCAYTRIAELEAACEKAEYELDWHSDELRTLEAEEQLFNNTFDAQQVIIEELRAENQRLREALEIIAGKRQCINNLMSNVEIAEAALLGGGE